MMSPPILPPYRHRFVEAGPVRIHCTELEGAGPPAFLLHGIGMDWRVWQGVARRLHPHFHLYLLDLRGHGQSDKPPSGYSLADYAADVEDVADELGLQGVVLIGSSLGGMVAVSVEAPVDIVSHRILVDPPITGGPVRDPEQLEDILRLKRAPADELAGYLAAMNPGAGRHLLRTMSEMWHTAADAVIIEPLRSRSTYFSIDRALTDDESPTLLLRADPAYDAALSEEAAARALQLLPRGSSVMVPGSGHAIHAFKPREFTQLVVEFTSTPA